MQPQLALPPYALALRLLSNAWYLPMQAMTERPPTEIDRVPKGDFVSLRVKLRALASAVLKLPHGHPDGEDVVQETLRRVLESECPPGVVFERWAMGVARHVSIDHIRKKQRERNTFAPIPDSNPDLQMATKDEGPHEILQSKEDVARFKDALELLPEGQRRAIELFHHEELDYDEIGKRLGVPKGTVATWLMRAKTSLHQALKDKGEKR